jgi:polyisoprenoid-binding protein YceI
MKKSLFLLFLLTIFLGNAQEFTQDTEKTKVSFKIKNFGVYVDGDFSEIDIKTNFQSSNLSESFINATIIVKSIATGIESRDKHILEEDYFDAPNHENITLTSTKIEKKGDGSYAMTADLTIKGTTKEIQVPIEFQETDDTLMIQSKFEINRKDFKVGGGSFIMSKKVKIQVEYTGTK